jgi:hypothetical protein
LIKELEMKKKKEQADLEKRVIESLKNGGSPD